MKFLSATLAAAVMLTATTASAEYIRFDDSSPKQITVTANGFQIDRLNVNGSVYPGSFSDASYNFAKGTALNFSATYFRSQTATDEDTTFLYVAADRPNRVIGQLQLNRSANDASDPDAQTVTGTFYGAGSRSKFAALGTGTTVVLDVIAGTTAYGGRQLIDGNFDLNVAITPGAAAAGVPEPASWAMMIGGFGLVGGTMRRRARVAKVRFA